MVIRSVHFEGVRIMSLEDLARQFYQAFNDRNIEEVAHQLVHPDCVLIDSPTGQESYGPEGAIESSMVWMNAFPDGRVKVMEMNVSGNVVTTYFHAEGTFTGDMMTPEGTIPGNGKKLSLDFEDILEFEGNMVVRNESNYDMGYMLQQLGLG
jgi:predicted ester cyclase